jgi:hypothetical protein
MNIPKGWKVVVRAITAEDYSKIILVMDEEQIRMTNGPIKSSMIHPGQLFDPKEFPEAVRFSIAIEPYQ